jgi:hypothetical protein
MFPSSIAGHPLHDVLPRLPWEPEDLWLASCCGHPYSYLASQAVDHSGCYFPEQSDWLQWITPSVIDTPIDDEIPF